MIEEAKILLIVRYGLKLAHKTKHNNIYTSQDVVLIENIVTGDLKLKRNLR